MKVWGSPLSLSISLRCLEKSALSWNGCAEVWERIKLFEDLETVFFHLIYLLSEFHFPQFWLVRCTTASSHLSHQLNITYENLKNAVIKTYNAYASSGYAFLHSPIVADPLIAYQIATKLVPEDECLCNEHRRFSTWNSIRVGNWIYLEGAEG